MTAYSNRPSFDTAEKLSAYRAASTTLPPVYQIVMLYDGVIGFLKKARSAIEAQRVEERHVNVTKAASIVDGLQNCLDHDKGGLAALELHHFYTSAFVAITRIDIGNDAGMCDQLIEKFTDIRSAWAQLARVSMAAAGPALAGMRAPVGLQTSLSA